MPNRFGGRKIGSLESILTGALTGSMLGLTAVTMITGFNPQPFLSPIFAAMPLDPVITGPILGILIGGGIGGLVGYGLYRNNSLGENESSEAGDSALKAASIQLHAEQLDITKKLLKTGAVTIHKEIITEEKVFTVPVSREELMIQRRVLNPEDPNPTEGHPEIIRIPLSEERVEITKHPVVLENVSIYQRQFQDVEQVNEILKREIALVETHGECRVVEMGDEGAEPIDKD